MRFASLVVLAGMALCAACSDAPPPPPPPPQKTVIDDQLKALQKAKDVEKTLEQEKKDTDKKIDESGG